MIVPLRSGWVVSAVSRQRDTDDASVHQQMSPLYEFVAYLQLWLSLVLRDMYVIDIYVKLSELEC